MLQGRDKTSPDVQKLKSETASKYFANQMLKCPIISTNQKLKRDMVKRTIWQIGDISEVMKIHNFRVLIFDGSTNFDPWFYDQLGDQEKFCHIIIFNGTSFALCHLPPEQFKYDNDFLCKSIKRLVCGEGDNGFAEDIVEQEIDTADIPCPELEEIDELYVTPNTSPQPANDTTFSDNFEPTANLAADEHSIPHRHPSPAATPQPAVTTPPPSTPPPAATQARDEPVEPPSVYYTYTDDNYKFEMTETGWIHFY